MGQKTHPYGFRLGVIKTWTSKWYEDKRYTKWLHEDIRIKRAVKEYLYNANVAGVEVERAANKAKVIVYTARPGMVIGKGGKGIEILKTGNLETAAKGETKFPGVQSFTENEVFIDVQEVRKAETNAQLVAENIATQLERRIAFRRAMKKAMTTAMKFGAKGIRVRCAGRLGGAEMGRVETLPRRSRAAPHAARRHRVRPGRSPDDVRHHRRQGLDLQGRSPAAQGAPHPGVSHVAALSQAHQVPQAAEGQEPRHCLARLATSRSAISRLQAVEPLRAHRRARSRPAVWRFSAT